MPGSLTPSLQEGLVRLGTWLPFGPAAALLAHFTQVTVSKPTARRVTEAAGAAYAAVQTAEVERRERDLPTPPQGPDVLQVSVDGAMVPLVGGDWAEAKTVAIGVVAPPVLTQAGEREVHATDLSYFSRLADHVTFARLATVETHRRGVETAGVVCGVVDGAEWCQEFLDLHRLDAVRILDFPHAAGYLAQMAQAAHGEGSAAATAWRAAQCHTLKHESPTAVLAAARALRDEVAARGADAAASLEAGEQALASLEKRQDQLRYAEFRALGYPIGSGIAESANKLVVEARLKGAGMHWARAHVTPLLALRTVACTDRWEEAWPQLCAHLRQQRRTRAAQRRAAQRRVPCRVSQAAPAGPAVPTRPGTLALSPQPPPPAPLAPAVVGPVTAVAPRAATPRRPGPDHPWRRPYDPERAAQAKARRRAET